MYKYFWAVLLLGSFESYSNPPPCAVSFGKRVSLSGSVLEGGETRLRARGFSKYYTSAFDEAVWLVELQKRWKKAKADPEKTHIPFFAERVNSHIGHIGKSIKDSNLPEFEKYKKLRTLKALRNEADFRRKSKEVTASWWNIFNIRLIALVTFPVESAFHLGLSQDQLQSYHTVYSRLQELRESFPAFNGPYIQMLEKFPDVVLVPSINEAGPMAFNQTMSESIHFVGVSGADVRADGKTLSPQDYFKHDIEHIASIEEYLQTQDLSFHSQFKLNLEDLFTTDRERQELAYFLLLREREFITNNDSPVFQRNLIRFLRGDHDINLLPFSLRNRQYKDREEYHRVLQEYFKDMEDSYNSMAQEIRSSN